MERPFLFVALDGLMKKEKETLEIAERLSSVEGNFGFKVNLNYLLDRGLRNPSTLGNIQQFNRLVFTDLKMWNGTGIMSSIIGSLVDKGVDYLNVYALADDLLPEAIKIAEGSKTKILGLTVLTHFTEGYCKKWFQRSLKDTVRLGAEVALKRGCQGIILPGTVLDVVKDLDLERWTPGVRLPWYPEDARHQQEVEPRVAVDGGATGLICGGPIMKSMEKVGIDNVEALKRVLAEMMV
jgi:orotidine-5'-phosphate decarboxylase